MRIISCVADGKIRLKSTKHPDTSFDANPSSVRTAAGLNLMAATPAIPSVASTTGSIIWPTSSACGCRTGSRSSAVTPERAAVVEDELDPAVGNDRVGSACRRALEQPVCFDERRQPR